MSPQEREAELKRRYVAQKTRDLKEFGYTDLTKETVAEQYDKVMSGATDLSVIGMFIKADVDAVKEK